MITHQPRKTTSLANALADPAGVVRLGIIGAPIAVLPDEISSLGNLEILTLNGNGLQALPEALFELPRLRVLNLFNNALTEIPAGLLRLTRLESLTLGDNPLRQLPDDLAGCTSLRELNLANLPRLDFVQAWPLITQLAALEKLSLYQNPIDALPEAIGQLEQLRVLRLFACRLDLPASLAKLSRLEELDLRANQLSEFPFAQAAFPALRRLDLSYNPMNGVETPQ
jgi:Leucine-rich repeat (LRR) protein